MNYKDEKEMLGRPSNEAATKLSDFYHALALEQIDEQFVDPDLFPDTDAGMAVLQLDSEKLGRAHHVAKILVRTSLCSSNEAEPIMHDSRAAQEAVLSPLLAAAAGCLLGGESSEQTTVNAANSQGVADGAGEGVENAGAGPAQPSNSNESDFVLESTVPRETQVPQGTPSYRHCTTPHTPKQLRPLESCASSMYCNVARTVRSEAHHSPHTLEF